MDVLIPSGAGGVDEVLIGGRVLSMESLFAGASDILRGFGDIAGTEGVSMGVSRGVGRGLLQRHESRIPSDITRGRVRTLTPPLHHQRWP